MIVLKILAGLVAIIMGAFVIAACMLVDDIEREFEERNKKK